MPAHDALAARAGALTEAARALLADPTPEGLDAATERLRRAAETLEILRDQLFSSSSPTDLPLLRRRLFRVCDDIVAARRLIENLGRFCEDCLPAPDGASYGPGAEEPARSLAVNV